MQKRFFNRYTAAGVTDVGCVRKHNEDNFLIDDEIGLLIVADGMGGHEAGEIASIESIKVIVQMLRMYYRTQNNKTWLLRFIYKFRPKIGGIQDEKSVLTNALLEANRHIFQLNMERQAPVGTGMGTTIAGCWIVNSRLMLVFHIGDSRVYRFNKDGLECLTKDHSVLQDWVDRGKVGEQPKSNVINKAVGPYPETKPGIKEIKLNKADNFLLCSDGLTDMVAHEEIEAKLKGMKPKQIQNYCKKLLVSALEKGGRDNISVILMAQD